RLAITLCLLVVLLMDAPLLGQAPTAEIYQDFRGRQPLQPSLTLDGPDADETVTAEDEGLRIKLPATRRRVAPVGVATTFRLSGDFEVTGTYLILSADRPPNGNGVGVALNIATDPELRNFAKVGRFVRPQKGHVHIAEAWNKDIPDNYKVQMVSTTTMSGRL